jgi:hypothetical protein
MAVTRATSCLLYGDSGDGKTALIGELAEHVFATSGKITRLYCADPGGWRTVQPYVDLGIIEAIDCLSLQRPWEWTMAIVRGKVPTPLGAWVLDPERNAKVGMYAFEGFTGIADVLMQDLARKAAEGINIGGQAPATKFQEGDAKIAGNSPAHYGNVQTQLTMAAQESFHLAAEYVVWTALARRATDNDTNAPILGPQIVGKALTSEAPRWFAYTFRAMATPPDAITKKEGSHTLFFDDHTDITMPGAKGLGNSRAPLDAVRIPPITPASIVTALRLMKEASEGAEGKIRARLATAGVALPTNALPEDR